MARPDDLILGWITKVHGVRGEVKVALYADAWAPFSGVACCWVGPSGGPFRPVKIEAATDRGRAVILKLEGVDSPEMAASVIGHDVLIPRAEAPAPAEGTFYHYDILGMEVVAGGRPLGVVRDILETPAHDVYVVDGPTGEWLLPATRVHIRHIDVAAGRIEVDPAADLAGLVGGAADGKGGSESV
jgi:16S rRNA processing protein RimM